MGVDTLVLGCTHYPLLTGVLSYVMGDGVTLVSSAEETAKDVYALLVREGLERDGALPAPEHGFLTTGRPEEFATLARRFLGPEIESVQQFTLGGSGMKLTVIGCAGSFAGPDSPASCYLLEAPFEGRTYRLLIDLGSGAFGPLQRYSTIRDIDAVAISHLHADHCFDMSGFYVVSRYHPDGAFARIPVHAPEGAGDFLVGAYGVEENRRDASSSSTSVAGRTAARCSSARSR